MLRSLLIGLTALALSAPAQAQPAVSPSATETGEAPCSTFMTEDECQAHRHILRILPDSSVDRRAYVAMVSHLLSEREGLCSPQGAGKQAAVTKTH